MEAIRTSGDAIGKQFSRTFDYRGAIEDHSEIRSKSAAAETFMRKSMEIDKISDEMLLERISQRDVQAVDTFYDRHAQKVFNVLVRIVSDKRVAEELLQETFLLVWQKVDGYKGNGSVAAWIFRIARNKGLDHLRRRKARPEPVDDSQDSDDLLEGLSSATSTHVETQVSLNLDKALLSEALAAVPEEQRQCLELAYFQGMSQREIAEHTNVS